MKDTSGQKSSGLSTEPTPLGLFSKMSLALFPCLTPSSKIWKKKVTIGKRILFRLSQSALHTKEKGSGLLPTPQASDYRERGNLSNPCIQRRIAMGRQVMLSMILTTPNVDIQKVMATPLASQSHKPIRALAPSEANGSHGIQIPASIGQQYPQAIGKKINPQFLEWMMGYPMGWTEIKPSETL